MIDNRSGDTQIVNEYIDAEGNLTDQGMRSLSQHILGDLVAVDVTEAGGEAEGLDIIPGLVSRAVTLLFGESMAGKTFLASNIIASLHDGRQVLGCSPAEQGIKSLIVATDTQAGAEYQERFSSQGIGPGVATVVQVPAHPSTETWSRIVEYAELNEIGFLVVDHASTALGVEGRNDEREWNALYDELDKFLRINIPVLLVGHSSDVRNFGKPSYKPMGSATATQRARARIGVFNQSGRPNDPKRLIRTDSNTRGAGEIHAVLDVEAAVMKLRDEAPTEERQHTRSIEKQDTNQEIMRLALQAPPMNQALLLEHLAREDTIRGVDGEPLSTGTIRNRLNDMKDSICWDRKSQKYVKQTAH